jgi:tetratricopeptide (TPR) repeat protein
MIRKLLSFIFLILLSSCFGSFSEGERLFRSGAYEEAVSEFSRALFLNVTDIKSLHLRARAHEELESFEDALKDYKAILQLDPTYAQAHAGIGKIYWKLENYRQAENHLLIAAKHDAKDFEIVFLLARTMLMNERYQSAEEFFQIAKELEPKDARVHFYQGMARSQIGDILGAAGSFNSALRYDPDNLTALYNRGLVLMLIGHSSWALEDFNAVLREKPGHVEALAHRGVARLNLKDSRGCSDLQQALARGSIYARVHQDKCK